MHTAEDASEPYLIERARDGDKAAFGRLVEAHPRAVLNTAHRLLGQRQETQEASRQEQDDDITNPAPKANLVPALVLAHSPHLW